MLFCMIPLAYHLAGMLNSSQAGKSAFLGFFTLTTLFAWREIFPGLRAFRLLIFISLLLLATSIVFQAVIRQIFGVPQDHVLVVQALLNTNIEETIGFISQYYRHVIPHLLIMILFLICYWHLVVMPPEPSGTDQAKGNGWKRRCIAASVFTLFLVVTHSNSSLSEANPLFYLSYNFDKAMEEMTMARKLRDELVKGGGPQVLAGMHLAVDRRRHTVVLVIGESDTRNNWSLYGYGRRTTPELEKLRERLLVFRDVIAADGATVGSVSKMLTAATGEKPDLWVNSPTVMAIARHLGYKVFWLANQGTADRGVVPILASQAETTIFTSKGIDRGESSFDADLLAPFQQALDDPAARKLIILQLLGAHPAYNFRYPKNFAVFEKVLDDDVANDLKDQRRAPWAILSRNSYDCAIRYEDSILSQLLQGLMEKEPLSSAWLYVSDHGQDVAHNSNLSGHNIRARQQWEVPFVLWLAPDAPMEVPAAELVNRPYRADVLDHTLLGLLDVRGELYDPELDILSASFKAQRIVPRMMAEVNYD